MEIGELYKERKKIINKFKDEKELLRIKLKDDLKVVDDKIKGKREDFSNKQAKTVKQVMGQVKKGGRVRPDTFKWNKTNPKKKTQPIKKKEQ